MTNIPPSPPESSPKTPLGFDEFIAILVAFATMGGILFWSISRNHTDGELQLLPSSSPSQPDRASSPPQVLRRQPRADKLDATAVQPRTIPQPTARVTPPQVFPPAKRETTAIKSPPKQMPLSRAKGLEAASVESLSLPLVIPAQKKSTIPPPIAFNDVPSDFWASRYIDVLSSRGIIQGFSDYSFRPNQPINRAEFAVIIQKAFNQKLTQSTTNFKDLAATYWATPAIEEVIGTGFLTGYPDQTFQAEQNISRVQVLVALVSGLNLEEPSNPDQVLNIYQDAEAIPQYALAKIATATENNLVINHPDPNILAPNKEATRAEVAVMVHQALVRSGRLK